mmetsp:Transcript_4979/g.4571  ORF Transcript_4979/g.4571 Transcript_4979/m.4571 type:complete len:87 (+) Transcript_4979:997-1257(+)
MGRMKTVLNEPFEVVKELKFSEVRAMMEIGWETQIELCQQLEKVLQELLTFFGEKPLSPEEKQFLKNTVQGIEQCLQRQSQVVIPQ